MTAWQDFKDFWAEVGKALKQCWILVVFAISCMVILIATLISLDLDGSRMKAQQEKERWDRIEQKLDLLLEENK